jgi:hypothetical protein
MVQQIMDQNRELMRNLRTNLAEAKKDISAFLVIWKYMQGKEKRYRLHDKAY